jgi:hypothetical protein
MKNPICILLITIHLFAYTDFSQLVKFPLLLSHYKEHLSYNESLSFFDFLGMHYGGDAHAKNNPDRNDSKLPFKTLEFHIAAHAVIAPQFAGVPVAAETIIQPLSFNYYSSFVSQTPCGGLFRPPIFTA